MTRLGLSGWKVSAATRNQFGLFVSTEFGKTRHGKVNAKQTRLWPRRKWPIYLFNHSLYNPSQKTEGHPLLLLKAGEALAFFTSICFLHLQFAVSNIDLKDWTSTRPAAAIMHNTCCSGFRLVISLAGPLVLLTVCSVQGEAKDRLPLVPHKGSAGCLGLFRVAGLQLCTDAVQAASFEDGLQTSGGS